MRSWTRPFWVALAVLFLIEAWFWRTLEPLTEAIVRAIPFAAMKAAVARMVDRLPAWAALALFLIPFLAVQPMKFVALALAAQGHIVMAIAVYAAEKLIAFSVLAFLFESTKPKLLTIGWFAQLHDWVAGVLAWARATVEPVKARIRAAMRSLRGRAARRLRALRAWAFREAKD